METTSSWMMRKGKAGRLEDCLLALFFIWFFLKILGDTTMASLVCFIFFILILEVL